MRKESVTCKSSQDAYQLCPWASICVRVCGGFMCFECIVEYEVWKETK